MFPPQPAAPMPRELAYACAAMTCLAAHKAAGLAMLLSHDCWLRIGEVSATCVRDVTDTRAQADPVGRGVSVFIIVAKTGRRQAVMIEDAEIAALLLA